MGSSRGSKEWDRGWATSATDVKALVGRPVSLPAIVESMRWLVLGENRPRWTPLGTGAHRQVGPWLGFAERQQLARLEIPTAIRKWLSVTVQPKHAPEPMRGEK